MEDYRLEQSGQEVQDILNGAAMQTDLTAEETRATEAEQNLQGHIDDEELRAKGAESTLQDHIDDEAAARQGADSTLQDHIDAEETRAKAAEKQNADDIDLIEEKIPSAASSSNQLADKAFVNSSIATASAIFRGTFNLVSDLHLTLEATEQQIATALAGAIATADNNDYAFIQIPTSDETPTQIAEIDRYKYNGSAWAFEYALNNSGFTAAQWAAINSTVTSSDMTKLRALPTNAQLTTLLNGLQGGIDDEETRAKTAELALQGAIDDEETRAKGVELSLQGAIGDEETARQGADSTLQDNIDAEETRAKAAEKQNADDIDLIEEKIPSSASSSNKLATASDVSDLSAAIEAILLLIPSAASSLNQLADKAFVNSSIATASATFRGTYNLVTDLGLTILATHAQIETALAGKISTADNNDYCFVQIPTSADTPTEIAKTERYKYNGSEWAYEYDLNNSGYTAAQWAAINSGITSALVTKLSALPTNAELTTALGALTDGIDTINEKIPSAASISNKLVDTSALESYVTQVINAIDATFNITSTDGHVNVQITQVNGVITAVSVNTSDIASADALAVIGGRVTTAEGNITSLAGRVSTNETDIAQLQALYETLTESEPEIIQPTDTWPVANPSTDVIYRVVDRVNTPPEYYSDYMWNGTTMVLMATYDNAIDDEPTPGSNNLVKSGGVASNIVFDISRYHATGSTLATYADLAAALGTNAENVPADIRRGGMSIKFVHTSDNNYVQARCMAQNFTTDVTQWQGVDEIPMSTSHNLVESSGVENKLIKIEKETIGIDSTSAKSISATGSYQYFDVNLAQGEQFKIAVSGTAEWSRLWIAYNNNAGRLQDFVANNTEYTITAPVAITSIEVYMYTMTTAGTVSLRLRTDSIIKSLSDSVKKAVPSNTINLFNPNDTDVVIGKRLNGDGTLTTDATYNTSGFIPVSAETVYYARLGGYVFRFVNFYSEDKTIISQVSQVRTFTTPADCRFVRITFFAADYTEAQVTQGNEDVYSPYNIVGRYINDYVLQWTRGVCKKVGKNKFNKHDDSIISNSYLNTDGSIKRDKPNYKITHYIPFESGKLVLSYDGVKQSSGIVGICYYNENKQYVSGETIANAGGVATWRTGVKYVRFSIISNGVNVCQIEEGEYATAYEPFMYYIHKNDIEPDTNIPISKSQRISGTVNSGSNIELPIVYCRYAQNLSAIITGTISGSGVEVGRGRNDGVYGGSVKVTATEVTINGINYTHGLTLTNKTFVMLTTDNSMQGNVVVMTSAGDKFEQEITTSIGGAAYVKNNTGAAIDVELSFESRMIQSPIWLIGDSYMSYATTRWPYYLIHDWGFNNFLIDNKPGANSAGMWSSLWNLLKLGNPKYLVWALGMNGGQDDNDAVNADWLSYVNMLLFYCKERGIEPILATIPSVPDLPHEKLNDWVRSSGYRYIDFAKAVNAQPDGTWDTGLLSTDNVHPTEAGAKVLASRVLIDFPEISMK